MRRNSILDKKLRVSRSEVSLLLASCVTVIIVGCTIYRTGADQGLPYFLPKGQIHIAITETKSTSSTKSDTASNTTGTNASVTVNAQATASLPNPSATPTPTPTSASSSAITTNISRTIKVEAIIVPDKDKGARSAHYVPNALQDDIVDLKVDPNTSLLQTTSATSTDQTAQIIADLVTTGVNVTKAVAGFSAMNVENQSPAPTATPTPYRPLDFDITFEPEDWPTEKTRTFNGETVDRILNRFGITIEVLPTASPYPVPKSYAGYAKDTAHTSGSSSADYPDPNRNNGLWFRQLRGYEVIITQRDVSAYESLITKRRIFSVILPDKDAPFCFVVSRGAFIKKTTSLTIANGVLQAIHIEKPSEIAGFVKIPLNLSQQIADLPKGIIGAKVDVVTSENNLVTQQANLLSAQAKLIKAQQDLQTAQQAAASGGSTPH